MLTPLTPEQQQWVETSLSSMTLEACVGQLLCPMMPRFSTDDWPGFASARR